MTFSYVFYLLCKLLYGTPDYANLCALIKTLLFDCKDRDFMSAIELFKLSVFFLVLRVLEPEVVDRQKELSPVFLDDFYSMCFKFISRIFYTRFTMR